MDLTPQTLSLTPHGRLLLVPTPEALGLDGSRAEALATAFERGTGHGLLRLGGTEVGTVLPPVFAYFRDFAARYLTTVCTRAETGDTGALPDPPAVDLEAAIAAGPLMTGAEYLTTDTLRTLWHDLGDAFAAEWRESEAELQPFLRSLSPAWNLVGRVHFNLAENRRDEEAPFAFLATYTGSLSAHGKAQHQPLGQAMREFAGATSKDRLLSLLVPVQRAAQHAPWLRRLVDSSEIFHPLRWSPNEALELLREVPALEQAGVLVRMPAGWRGGRPARPKVSATVGAKAPAELGKEALLDFHAELVLDGEPLTSAEIAALLAGTDGLVLVRGKWVELDRARLQRALERFKEAERLAGEGGLPFGEAMRLLSGAELEADAETMAVDADWAQVTAGAWLATTLKELRSPEALAQIEPGRDLHGQLRPYQQVGVRWLDLLSRLGLGACLADDMGLGKTIQVLSLLLVARHRGGERRPSLLVAPASLLANWAAEIERFAPSITALVAHPSVTPTETLKTLSASDLSSADLVITSYGSLLRLPWLITTAWRHVILDEAQAIKNPGTQVTRAVKKLSARSRIALTGTPVENRLGDLWSIFDFLNPGLLGTRKAFTTYSKRLAAPGAGGYGPLRDLVRPYILRRLKTDKSVISDLPEKTEVKAFCPLSRKQTALYQQSVKALAKALKDADPQRRRGVILAALMRFKQICNHPSQWLGDGAYLEADSGKWTRLREIAEVVDAKQEKVLVFTQFRELTAPLATFLGSLFRRPGLVLHGEVEVKKRRALVEQFQEDERVPFFVLSLKAGGSGLNLTAASHVVHFDRWWNPAVEDQATDRAFRIGQKKNVLVHKFVCRGTVEDKIDALIDSKKQLSRDLLEGGAEVNLTELGDQELLKLVALDLNAAAGE